MCAFLYESGLAKPCNKHPQNPGAQLNTSSFLSLLTDPCSCLVHRRPPKEEIGRRLWDLLQASPSSNPVSPSSHWWGQREIISRRRVFWARPTHGAPPSAKTSTLGHPHCKGMYSITAGGQEEEEEPPLPYSPRIKSLGASPHLSCSQCLAPCLAQMWSLWVNEWRSRWILGTRLRQYFPDICPGWGQEERCRSHFSD